MQDNLPQKLMIVFEAVMSLLYLTAGIAMSIIFYKEDKLYLVIGIILALYGVLRIIRVFHKIKNLFRERLM